MSAAIRARRSRISWTCWPTRTVMGELGVHFETSANEATAAAMLAASVKYPIRGAVAWKSTVGTNVASDALSNLASGGVTGGAVIIIGEDYGEGSSIMQERTHAFAMKSQIWLLDPRPNLPTIVDVVEDGVRTVGSLQHAGDARGAHPRLPCPRPVHRQGQQAARLHPARGAGEPVRDVGRIVLPPAVLPAREGEDREALAGRGRLHQGAQAQRALRAGATATSASSCKAACTTA